MSGPDPNQPYPLDAHRRVGLLKPLIDQPNIEVGEFTYYDDPDGPEHFVERNVLYHFDFIGDRLVIGKFCALASGVRFIMNGANHAVSGFSTFPFEIFGHGWENAPVPGAGSRGDTVIGNDVWIGNGAVILPGVRIGDGAVIGARSVVAKPIPPYAIVTGNPGQVTRMRFEADTIKRLTEIAWWDWGIDAITRHLAAIRSADLDSLEAAAHDVRNTGN